MSKIKIIGKPDRTDILINDLTRVWEDSVRKIHLFLSEDAIAEIKEYVPEALRKIEMLFISPDGRGKVIEKHS